MRNKQREQYIGRLPDTRSQEIDDEMGVWRGGEMSTDLDVLLYTTTCSNIMKFRIYVLENYLYLLKKF
jgi:hypothetical protein